VSITYKIKVLWLENSLGIAIDQVNSNVSLQITSFYFWPKTDAWEQVKSELKSKLWIKERDSILMLNTISEIMNHWQKNRKNQGLEDFKAQFKNVEFVGAL